MNISVRGVEEKLFKEFKSEAIKEGKKIGEALNEALELWIRMRRKRKKFKMVLQPFDWGEGSERASLEIDEIVYGD